MMKDGETIASRVAGATVLEGDAARLLLALETQIMADTGEARAAERYGERLRFALARVQELRRSAQSLGGVFEPARLEVALSILESNVRQATLFADRIVARMPKHVATRVQAAAGMSVDRDESTSAAEERAA